MNSSLQCLSNVEELTTFMVNGDYVNDLNPANPLGASNKYYFYMLMLMKEYNVIRWIPSGIIR